MNTEPPFHATSLRKTITLARQPVAEPRPVKRIPKVAINDERVRRIRKTSSSLYRLFAVQS